MTKPTGYNVPSGVDAEDFLSEALLSMLTDVFVAVTDAFGDDASLYRIDIGNLIKSTEAGGMVFGGQFVDRSDGEIFNFEINQATNKLQYKSSGEFLNDQDLAAFSGELHMEEADQASEKELRARGEQLYELLYDATHNPASEAGQSPFGIKLSKDLDYLAALSAAMYQAVITIEAQPLYAGLHSYVIQYALRGLRLFAQAIGNAEGPNAGALAEKWLDANGINFATGFVRAFSSQRCDLIKEQIQAEDHSAIEQLEATLEESLAMAMSCTIDLIKNIAAADDYQEGDVGSALTAAIEEYCPIDDNEGYHVSEHPRQLAAEWQQVIEHSGCSEDLSMNALGLPVADRIPRETEPTTVEKTSDLHPAEGNNAESGEGERIFYVNVGEGPSRSWDDCRQFGFLAAGGGRKWSKQLEKIQIGDTVIAYLKGYGYVGIGRVTCTATPATKFMVNGVMIKELPLVNDTIRSIKRFSKENGEYLIGVDWQETVPREKAAWQANAGLYTTALVCARLANQPKTVDFVINSFRSQVPSMRHESGSKQETSDPMQLPELPCPQTCDSTIDWMKQIFSDSLYEDVDTDDVVGKIAEGPWASNDELLKFFRVISIELAQTACKSSDEETASIFDRPIYYGLSLWSPYFRIWELSFATNDEQLHASVPTSGWETELDPGIDELSLISLIPLATAYEQPLFEALRNNTIGLDGLTEAQEEFLGYVAAMLGPGYYDGALPTEIVNIPSSKILGEILEDWSQYPDIWTPDLICQILRTPFADQRARELISIVLKGEDTCNPEGWEEHRENEWTEDDIHATLELCGESSSDHSLQ